MKTLVFDSGPLISLTLSNLLWTLEPLRRHLGGRMVIARSVRKELVDKPMQHRELRYQAMLIEGLIADGVLEEIGNDQTLRMTKHLQHLANTTFKAMGNWVEVVHFADMESLSLGRFMGAEAIVIDERNTRLLLEDPRLLQEHLRSRLHVDVGVHEGNLREFCNLTKGLRALRSAELSAVACELGLFDALLSGRSHIRLLEALLWSLKRNGCALSAEEIRSILTHSALTHRPLQRR